MVAIGEALQLLGLCFICRVRARYRPFGTKHFSYEYLLKAYIYHHMGLLLLEQIDLQYQCHDKKYANATNSWHDLRGIR